MDLSLTQIVQSNVHGGASTASGARYSGSADLTLTLDTEKLGLWEGGTIIINAEPWWGNSVNSEVGALLPVNYDAFKPAPGEAGDITLSEWYIWQEFVKDRLYAWAGKVDSARVFDKN
ncbi:MAG: carbohydrate porin, partial [Planctomycetota bacterium]